MLDVRHADAQRRIGPVEHEPDLAVFVPELLRHFQEGLDFLSEDDKAWILGKSLAKILDWPE